MPKETLGIKLNLNILRHCRKQMSLSIEEAQRKAGMTTLLKVEAGEREPTFKQIEKLSGIYLVPSWVFMEEALPKKYNFSKTIPSFRKFQNSQGDKFKYKSRFLITMIESFRETIIDLKKEMKESVHKFSPPIEGISSNNIESCANEVRSWLGVKKGSLNFKEWRKRAEKKGVFIFATSVFPGWSKIEPSVFRGLSVYHETLPKIEISRFRREIDENRNIKTVKKIARKFKVSDYATIVRLRVLKFIDQKTFNKLKSSIDKEHEIRPTKSLPIPIETTEAALTKDHREHSKIYRYKSKLSADSPAKKMNKRLLKQYGGTYLETIIQAYFNKDITLHKARNMLGLKKTDYILKLIEDIA